MELHINAQHTALEPELRDWITARLDALNAKETQPSLDRPVRILSNGGHVSKYLISQNGR